MRASPSYLPLPETLEHERTDLATALVDGASLQDYMSTLPLASYSMQLPVAANGDEGSQVFLYVTRHPTGLVAVSREGPPPAPGLYPSTLGIAALSNGQELRVLALGRPEAGQTGHGLELQWSATACELLEQECRACDAQGWSEAAKAPRGAALKELCAMAQALKGEWKDLTSAGAYESCIRKALHAALSPEFHEKPGSLRLLHSLVRAPASSARVFGSGPAHSNEVAAFVYLVATAADHFQDGPQEAMQHLRSLCEPTNAGALALTEEAAYRFLALIPDEDLSWLQRTLVSGLHLAHLQPGTGLLPLRMPLRELLRRNALVPQLDTLLQWLAGAGRAAQVPRALAKVLGMLPLPLAVTSGYRKPGEVSVPSAAPSRHAVAFA